jgi:hypothetical protein
MAEEAVVSSVTASPSACRQNFPVPAPIWPVSAFAVTDDNVAAIFLGDTGENLEAFTRPVRRICCNGVGPEVALLRHCDVGRFRNECVAKLSLRRRMNRDSVGSRRDSRERSMMGRREHGQGEFFYAFDLDKVVPPDHLVRQIDAALDLSWVHRELWSFYSHTGRPSIDPVLMIRMLIVGYVFAIVLRRAKQKGNGT